MKIWSPADALPADERPSLLAHAGEQLYLVNHLSAATPPARGAIVLAGPMSLERTHAYLSWVRWARTLALNGFDVWRFDYRGVGESTGSFDQQTFGTWQADLDFVTNHAREQLPGGRVIVIGLRLGALLARTTFNQSLADAFIAWDAPLTGKAMLMDMLRRKLAADYMEFSGGEKKTRDDYVRELENGKVVEVEGYDWSQGLWRSAAGYAFEQPERAGDWLSVSLDAKPPLPAPFGVAVKIPRPVFWLQSSHLVAELNELFTSTLERLNAWAP